ncbi:hypothetical protein [Mesorhizobium sp. Root172]|uniref:hypothetical protein n=1 Tax=Mesorhizobium sp. Root172 TaxID=1736481 RepID=UPI000A691B2E|nr:hypothetical protein [Mesorhizobium sp. Root172]
MIETAALSPACRLLILESTLPFCNRASAFSNTTLWLQALVTTNQAKFVQLKSVAY